MHFPKVGIVILNFNGLDDTIECLFSLSGITYPHWEAIVIDNGSHDMNELSQIMTHCQRVIPAAPFAFYLQKTNIGFAGGNNIGIRYFSQRNCEYLLFLNNDTLVERDFLDQLVFYAEMDKGVGIVGPSVFLHQKQSRLLYSCGGTARLWYSRVWEKTLHSKSEQGIDFINGCCFLARKEVIEKVGQWDEKYFLYWEDFDYCIRAKKNGYRISCVPDAHVYHKVAQSAKYMSSTYVYYMTRNNILFANTYLTGYPKALSLLYIILRRACGYMFRLIMKGKIAYSVYIFLAVCHGLANKGGRYIG